MLDRRHLLASLILAPLAPRLARADMAAPWARDTKSAVRLIAGQPLPDGRLCAGLHLRLDAGTKTYWRMPGDSGVPPVFDWAGSDNLGAVEIGWPGPMRFPDGNGFSIGYKSDVVFPLAVKPADDRRPVRLKLKIDYAVCDQVCIPARGETGLTLAGAADPQLAALIARFAARVPQPAVEGLSLAVAGLDRSGRHPVLTLEARVADAAGPVDLFAEGPDTQWTLPLPEALDSAGATRRFRLELDGAPRGVDPLASPLTFTLVAGERALEKRLGPF